MSIDHTDKGVMKFWDDHSGVFDSKERGKDQELMK